MNIEKKPGMAGIKAKLILSFEENGYYWQYYQIFSSKGLCVFLQNEFTTSWSKDYYILYFDWQLIIKKLNTCESKSWLPLKNKWWSYCPQWLYFTPVFIENSFRPLINNELFKLLDGIFETDLSTEEKYRFNVWMNACKLETNQLNLFT